MNEKDQKKIFANNLNALLEKKQLTQLEVANAIGVSAQTFNTWCREIAIPRMDKIQRLADYFHVNKSDLIDDSSSSSATSSSSADQTASLFIDRGEEHLIDVYRDLNRDGKEKLVEYADDLAGNDKYKGAEFYEEKAM